MAIVVNTININISGKEAVLSANINIDTFAAQDFSVKIHADAKGKKAELGRKMKELVLAEQVRLIKEATAQSVVTAGELQTYLNA